MKKIKSEIAKLISSSGDLQGATWEELRKIDKLVNLFKSYTRSLVPERKNPQPEYHPVVNNDEGYNYEEVYNPREINFTEGYNQCREEILNKIDKENK